MTVALVAPVTHVAASPPASGPSTQEAANRPFADLLRSHRERAGLTQRVLADLSTVSPRAIRDLEAGRANARTQTLHLLADGLRLQGLMRQVFVQAGLTDRYGGSSDPDVGPVPPGSVNALLGRDTEVRAMTEVLESDRRRMISISGLPGVGKSRVAAELAARLRARRGWPVLWIGTGPCPPGGTGTAFEPLLRSLRSLIESHAQDAHLVYRLVGHHEALVVLDGMADVKVPAGVVDLLAYCPGVRVISTSQAPWQVPGVQAAVISPLATPRPDGDGRPSLNAFASVPSVRLLADRLAEVRPGFTLNPTNVAAVAQLCRRLDGLPLALEVVAARFRVLSLQQLSEVPVPDLLDLPVPARSGAAPATLHGQIRCCYERLDAGRRAMLGRLASFERTWTVADAARALHRARDEVLDDLSVLIGHGFVRASHDEPATDFHVPNVVRASLLR